MAEETVWRYISLAKYVDLLRSRTLFLPKASLFSDDTEGKWVDHALLYGGKEHWSGVAAYADKLEHVILESGADNDAVPPAARRMFESLPVSERRKVIGDVLKRVQNGVKPEKRMQYLQYTVDNWRTRHQRHNDHVLKVRDQVVTRRESTYVSCWTISEHLSLAMWQIYGGSTESVAIRTSKEKLQRLLEVNRELLQRDGYHGEIVDVEYLDNLEKPSENLQDRLIEKISEHSATDFGIFSVKPTLYAFEQELRIIVCPLRDVKAPLIDPHPDRGGLTLRTDESHGADAIALSDLIDAVHIHPTLDDDSMMARTVASINEKFGVGNVQVQTSKLEALGIDVQTDRTASKL